MLNVQGCIFVSYDLNLSKSDSNYFLLCREIFVNFLNTLAHDLLTCLMNLERNEES
jgi:hypothetical protein